MDRKSRNRPFRDNDSEIALSRTNTRGQPTDSSAQLLVMDQSRTDWKVRLIRTHGGSNALPLSCKFNTAYALIIPQSDHRLHARADFPWI